MKIKNFVELPVTTWNGCCHIGVKTLFNEDEISKVEPQGKWRQTKITFKDGHEEFIEAFYKETIELMKA